jgi:hypothetical protein
MPTNTAGSQARVYHQAQTHYLDYSYTFATLPGTSSVVIGTVPAGAAITRILSAVNVAFNAGSSNVYTIGTTASGTNILASGTNGSVGAVINTVAVGSGQMPQVDTQLFLTGAPTGTAATAGAATLYIEYLVPSVALV